MGRNGPCCERPGMGKDIMALITGMAGDDVRLGAALDDQMVMTE